MRDILIDKRLPREVIENKGFTKDGYEYKDLFYIPYRFSINENIKVIITDVPTLFFNEKLFDNLICAENGNRFEMKDKQ